MRKLSHFDKMPKAGNVLAREKAVLLLMLIAICWSLVYGIIVKLTFGNDLLFSLKTYVPEALMLCALLVAGFGGLLRGIDRRDALLVCLLGLSFCLGLAFDDASNAPVLFRDVYIPVFFLLLVVRIDFGKEAIDWFLRTLTFVMILYVIGSLALYVVEARNGYDWTARFYTGYSFWGQDPVSKVQINSNGQYMRLPALTGSSVKSAMYAVFALALFLSNRRLKSYSRVLMIVVSFACVSVFNNRASLLAAVILVVVHVIRKTYKGKEMGLFLGILLTAFGFAVLLVMQLDGDSVISLDSLFARLSYWRDMFSDRGLESALLPVNVFSASAGGVGIEGLGLSTDWDNAFLYILFVFGIPVFLFLLAFFIGQWRSIKADLCEEVLRKQCNELCMYLLIATAVIALTTNIFQGRSWFFLFVLVYCVVSRPVSNCESKEPCGNIEVIKRGW